MNGRSLRDPLPLAIGAYAAASFIHFLHNAIHLDRYPNLPDSFTPISVMATWILVAAVGAAGWLLHRADRRGGLGLLAAFGASGYAGLLHYTRAPMADHSFMMNTTILLESITGSAVLVAVVWTARRR